MYCFVMAQIPSLVVPHNSLQIKCILQWFDDEVGDIISFWKKWKNVLEDSICHRNTLQKFKLTSNALVPDSYPLPSISTSDYRSDPQKACPHTFLAYVFYHIWLFIQIYDTNVFLRMQLLNIQKLYRHPPLNWPKDYLTCQTWEKCFNVVWCFSVCNFPHLSRHFWLETQLPRLKICSPLRKNWQF